MCKLLYVIPCATCSVRRSACPGTGHSLQSAGWHAQVRCEQRVLHTEHWERGNARCWTSASKLFHKWRGRQRMLPLCFMFSFLDLIPRLCCRLPWLTTPVPQVLWGRPRALVTCYWSWHGPHLTTRETGHTSVPSGWRESAREEKSVLTGG